MNGTLARIAKALIGAVLGAGTLYVLYHLARFLWAATAEERTWTGITAAFLAAVVFGYWVSCRMVDFVHAARQLLPHMESGAQYANRAALDARAMLDVLTEHWQRMRDQQPQTEPMERVGGPATMPESQAIGRIADFELAYELARLEQIMRGDRPTPKRRART